MLAHCFFVIAEKIRYVCNRHTALEQDSRKRMPEPVGRRPFLELPEPVTGVDDALQLLIGICCFVSYTIGTYRRLHVGADRVLRQPFPIHAKTKIRAQRADPLALGARAETPAQIETVDIGRRDLIKHHIAALRCEV
jgi:hypothetical protein